MKANQAGTAKSKPATEPFHLNFKPTYNLDNAVCHYNGCGREVKQFRGIVKGEHGHVFCNEICYSYHILGKPAQ